MNEGGPSVGLTLDTPILPLGDHNGFFMTSIAIYYLTLTNPPDVVNFWLGEVPILQDINLRSISSIDCHENLACWVQEHEEELPLIRAFCT
jgi:hypothetical protein